VFAPLVVGLLGTEMASDVQRAVQALVSRIFRKKLGMQPVKLMELGDRRRGSAVGSPEVGRTPGPR
jgi:brefeldin A-inhibited guanine nucleotide-exchange protein